MVTKNTPLAEKSTLHIGGPASYFATCHSEAEILDGLQFAQNLNLPVFILGGGSNILFPDEGFSGLILEMNHQGLTHDGYGTIKVESGMEWDQFVRWSCDAGFSGIECLGGIPGRVGATPIQNVGAYGQEVAETILYLEALNIKTRRHRIFTKEDCLFAYRDSYFKSQAPYEWVILNVTFKLSSQTPALPRYEELKDVLLKDPSWHQDLRQADRLHLIYQHVHKIRRKKGMVLDPHDPDSISLGSFFTNPILDSKIKHQIESRASTLGLKVQPTFFKVSEDRWKLSAAWLIENAGFQKGFAHGPAKISSKHVLAITNPEKKACAKDIKELASLIKNQVQSKFGVTLEQEPQWLKL